MDNSFPIYTTPNECQDCYKCVRHCSCKAIQIVNARAAVIPELCISCGECVKVCPAHAKKIRSDLNQLKFLINSGEKIYASIAPSYLAYFKNTKLTKIATALKELGFAGVSETALGAQIVSAKTAEFLRNAPDGVYISSACPAIVDYIRKYQTSWLDAVTPIVSPVIAHTRLLHEKYGNDAKVVFIGPCAAKKNEANLSSSDLNCAITFPTLEAFMESSDIEINKLAETPLIPENAEEGRAYSIEGGMNDTVRESGINVRYVAVSGIDNLARLLAKVDREKIKQSGGKLFIEALACHGGCVNGPAMPKDAGSAEFIIETVMSCPDRSSVGRTVKVDTEKHFFVQNLPNHTPNEDEIKAALQSIGKFTLADELNCGGCGYNSCREFAAAKLAGKAEAAMCLSYLRKISQKTSTALIKYIPVGVVIADNKLQIIECNRNFAEICGPETLDAFDVCGNLNGALLSTMIEFTDLFESVLANGGEIERMNQMFGDRIFNINVFSITPGQSAGAVVQDVTKSELRREQIAEKAREVIQKNVVTVQKIARYLGEHMADTEILLSEVAGAFEKNSDGDKK